MVLSASHEQDRCYVMTANLDGETSLKTRFVSIYIIFKKTVFFSFLSILF